MTDSSYFKEFDLHRERPPGFSRPLPLYLRVDVCTYRGLRDGVPGVLEALRGAGARATFFVTFGPDASGLALLKIFNPKFAAKMFRTGAPGMYGWSTAFYGTLLPSPLVGAGLPGVVRRIRDEGHEVAMHGWDHRRWQDRLPRYPRERLRDEFAKMTAAYREILGAAAASFGAPAWRVTTDLLEFEEGCGLAFAADTRGVSPFLPVFDGREFSVPQLPVTLPTLDESIGRMTREEFVAETLKGIASQPGYCCFAAHAESEGGAFRPELEAIVKGAGRPAVPLGEAPRDGLPRGEIRLGRIPGRPYDVCLQG